MWGSPSKLFKEELNRLIEEYEVFLNTQLDYEYGHIHDNPVEEFLEEPLFGDIVENHPHITLTEDNEDLAKLEKPIEQHISSDPIEDIHEGPLIEDIIEGHLHCAMIETTEDLKYPQDCFSEGDHMCIPNFPQEETIIETYKENYDVVYMVYDDTHPCSLHGDEGLESSLPCNIMETKLS